MMVTKWRDLTWLGLLVAVSFALASCGKKNSPPETRQSRLAWNLKTTVGAYQNIGNTDPKWDEAATNALAEFAASRAYTLSADEDWTTIIRTNCDAAVQAGCDDPLIRYLYIRFSMSQTNSPQDFAGAFRSMADDMQHSSYPNIRKFYAALRTAEQLKFAAGNIRETPPEVHQYRHLAVTNLINALDEKQMPAGEAYDACRDMLAALKQNESQYKDCYSRIQKSFILKRPDESDSWLLEGLAQIDLAWFARGSGYANTVTDDQWKAFRADLASAAESLNKAWKLNPKDPRIPIEMMTVDLGQGQGRDQMELWFGRAMELDPNNYDACSSKLYYLEPKWYGSAADMLDFGRECVASPNWGGRVPLILVDAHYNICNEYADPSERTNYWKQPQVWADIKSAYDKFFELNPAAVGYYYAYALYAYRAEQWDVFNGLIQKLEPVNYAYFGGQDEFNKMVLAAKENAAMPAAAPP